MQIQRVEVITAQPISAAEARHLTESIRLSIQSSRAALLELYERQGWRALGYPSWAACVQAEFGQSFGNLYEVLRAAKTERAIGRATGEIPTKYFRVLDGLDTDEQKKAAYDLAEKIAPEGRPARQHVEQAVRAVQSRGAEYQQGDRVLVVSGPRAGQTVEVVEADQVIVQCRVEGQSNPLPFLCHEISAEGSVGAVQQPTPSRPAKPPAANHLEGLQASLEVERLRADLLKDLLQQVVCFAKHLIPQRLLHEIEILLED